MSDGKSGSGFAIRMTILLILLAIVAFGFYYDRFVLVPQSEQTVEKAYGLLNKTTDDGGSIPKDMVQKELGFPPSETRMEGEYEVETYKFRRFLPFAPARYIEVVYVEGGLLQIVDSEPFDVSMAKDEGEIKFLPPDQRPETQLSVGGGGPPQGQADDDDDGDDDEGEAHDDDGDGAHEDDGDAGHDEAEGHDDDGDDDEGEAHDDDGDGAHEDDGDAGHDETEGHDDDGGSLAA